MKTNLIRLLPILFLFLLFPAYSFSQTAKEYFDKGNSKFDIKDFSGAIQDFTKAIKFNPKYAMAYNNRGFAKTELHDYIAAIQDYNKAIEFDPRNTTYYNNRAFANFDVGNFADARHDWIMSGELGNNEAYNNYRDYFKIKMGKTTSEVKEYFSDLKNTLDPLEGIWLRHLKTKHYYKGNEVPNWNNSDAQIVIVKNGELFECYYLEINIWNKVEDLLISNSASNNLYLYTFKGDAFFGCYSVDKSFRLVNSQFETNYERECSPKGTGTLMEVYSATYEKLFPL
jgi:Tetratricopeptide repeat